jgi:hypothetical protein
VPVSSSLAGSVESAFVSIPAGADCSLHLSFLLPFGFVRAAAPTRSTLAVSALTKASSYQRNPSRC